MMRKVKGAFREAGNVAWDCWSYLESCKAEEKGVTDPIETLYFYLWMIDSDDKELEKGGKSILNHWERTKKELPERIKAGYSRFIGFVHANGGDKGLDVFFNNVLELMEESLTLQTDRGKLSYAIGLVEPIQELASTKYEPYKKEDYYLRVLDPEEGDEGDYLDFLYYMGKQYINVLDAALLKVGVDLLEVQDMCGVCLLQERDILSLASILGGYKIAQAYIDTLPTRTDNPQQQTPDVLNTHQAQELISKAVEAGFVSVDEAGRHEWKGTKVLLSYFAVRATAYLCLKTNANATASWRPFETLFQEVGLRHSKAEYEKYHTVFAPTGSKDIDALFEP